MLDINKCLINFLEENVDLNKNRIERLKSSIVSIDEILKDKLNTYERYSPQGSYAHGTIIRPVSGNDEFDADILVFINDSNLRSKDYIEEIFQIFKNHGTYEEKVQKKTRCVTINYKGDFHLDIVPCFKGGDSFYIYNSKEGKYEKTDGEGYLRWLSNKDSITKGNLSKIIRLFKFLRDHKNTFSVKSILLTTIIAEQIQDNENFLSQNLSQILRILSNRVNDFLQQYQNMPIIQNPMLSTENFNRHWDENKYQNFKSKFQSYNTKINEACDTGDINKWQMLFGDEFKAEYSSFNVQATKPWCNFNEFYKSRN